MTDEQIKKIKDAAFKIAEKHGCRVDRVIVFYDIKVWLAYPEHPLPNKRKELEEDIKKELAKDIDSGFSVEVE